MNKLMKWYLELIGACITVSHCSKENLALRARIPAEKIFVVPNAVDASKFKPEPSLRYPKDTINIVCV